VYTLPWATLTSSTSLLKRKATSSLDFSDFANILTGLTTVSPLIDRFTTKNFIQEVRLASSGDGPFKWLIGGFYENYKLNLFEQISQQGVAGTASPYGGTFPTDFLEDIGIRTKITDYAFFGEASYEIVPDLTFTAGARYSDYSLETTNLGGISGQTLFDGPPSTVVKPAKNNAVTPKVSLSYKPNKNALIYVLASKGFRTGNTNLVSPLDPFTGESLPQSFDPDTLWNYEIGAKIGMLDNRLNINATAFYIDWNKIQLQTRNSSGFPYTAKIGRSWCACCARRRSASWVRSFHCLRVRRIWGSCWCRIKGAAAGRLFLYRPSVQRFGQPKQSDCNSIWKVFRSGRKSDAQRRVI
jgi:iron complex outermembrane recepter protein